MVVKFGVELLALYMLKFNHRGPSLCYSGSDLEKPVNCAGELGLKLGEEGL